MLRSALGFLHSTRAEGRYSAGGHMNRFQDIRRVRLSNPELGTRSAAEFGLRNYCIVRVILRGAVGFLH
eukprot:9434239-Pyramimonas_sp.AAC.1